MTSKNKPQQRSTINKVHTIGCTFDIDSPFFEGITAEDRAFLEEYLQLSRMHQELILRMTQAITDRIDQP